MQHIKPMQTVASVCGLDGAFLLCAGQQPTHSRIMIHQPLGGAQQASDIRIQADEILYLKKKLNQSR